MKVMGRWADLGHPDSLLEMMSFPLSNSNQGPGTGSTAPLESWGPARAGVPLPSSLLVFLLRAQTDWPTWGHRLTSGDAQNKAGCPPREVSLPSPLRSTRHRGPGRARETRPRMRPPREPALVLALSVSAKCEPSGNDSSICSLENQHISIPGHVATRMYMLGRMAVWPE